MGEARALRRREARERQEQHEYPANVPVLVQESTLVPRELSQKITEAYQSLSEKGKESAPTRADFLARLLVGGLGSFLEFQRKQQAKQAEGNLIQVAGRMPTAQEIEAAGLADAPGVVAARG